MIDIVMMDKGECMDDFTTFMQGGHPMPIVMHKFKSDAGENALVVAESEHPMPVVMHKFKSDAGENALIVAESGGSREVRMGY